MAAAIIKVILADIIFVCYALTKLRKETPRTILFIAAMALLAFIFKDFRETVTSEVLEVILAIVSVTACGISLIYIVSTYPYKDGYEDGKNDQKEKMLEELKKTKVYEYNDGLREGWQIGWRQAVTKFNIKTDIKKPWQYSTTYNEEPYATKIYEEPDPEEYL